MHIHTDTHTHITYVYTHAHRNTHTCIYMVYLEFLTFATHQHKVSHLVFKKHVWKPFYHWCCNYFKLSLYICIFHIPNHVLPLNFYQSQISSSSKQTLSHRLSDPYRLSVITFDNCDLFLLGNAGDFHCNPAYFMCSVFTTSPRCPSVSPLHGLLSTRCSSLNSAVFIADSV